MEVQQKLKFVRSLLYVPGSNARALEKARGLAADMLIVDLEDAVPAEAKEDARAAAVAYVATGVPGKLLAIRINAPDSEYYAADVAAIRASAADLIVVPKVESVESVDSFTWDIGKPVLAMIETPKGLFMAPQIAGHEGIAGLLAGTNDIAAETGIKPGPQRQGLETALQMIVLAAAYAGKPRFDGVNNKLDDMAGFEAECQQGVTYGFTGKTLIHPNQVGIANRIFAPDDDAVAEAEELIAASRGGAQRFRGRMIESMHVEQARLTIERSRHATGDG